MFIKKLQKRNPKLINVAINLYSRLEPNTYIIDLDTVKKNASIMAKEAKKHNIELYQMTKQFGRNPLVAKAIGKSGIPKVVAVDPWGAMVMIKNKIPLGNVGHLVQTPKCFLEPIIKYKPDVLTIFTEHKAKQISKIASKNNLVQDILIKVVGKDDDIYPGQEGGVKLKDFSSFLKKITKLKGINVVGPTSFPCFLYKGKSIKPTQNLQTVKKAIKIGKDLGFEFPHINIPSVNCTKTMKLIKKHQGTHGEPGHALTGTTPAHAAKNLEEIPAMLYVSEISHVYEDRAYFFGGGHYRRSNMKHVLLVSGKKKKIQKTLPIAPEAIDYYLGFKINKSRPKVGDMVIASFRTQIFITRSKVAVVSGIQKGKPKIEGIFTSLGEKIHE